MVSKMEKPKESKKKKKKNNKKKESDESESDDSESDEGSEDECSDTEDIKSDLKQLLKLISNKATASKDKNKSKKSKKKRSKNEDINYFNSMMPPSVFIDNRNHHPTQSRVLLDPTTGAFVPIGSTQGQFNGMTNLFSPFYGYGRSFHG